jgi:hypothetical protein
MPPAPVQRYVGLDIGKRTEYCELKQERVTQRATIDKEQQLEKLLGPGTERALVVYEACRQGWYLVDLLTGWGHEVWMVDTHECASWASGSTSERTAESTRRS